MRKERSIKNIIFNTIGQIAVFFTRFILQKIFLDTLGVELLGLNSLLVNVLQVLNIAELGVSSAIAFSLYKPLATEDKGKIRSIVLLYGKIYKFIGLFILILGLCFMPFLPNLINGNIDPNYAITIYCLYLAQSVLSYFFMAHKPTIAIADQKNYIVNLYYNVIAIITSAVQVSLILITHSLFWYAFALVISSIVKNLAVNNKINKMYPYLKDKSLNSPLTKIELKTLKQNIIGVSTYKISGTVLTSTDNIIISSFIDIATTGIYSNYLVISAALTTMINIFFSSIMSSIGNLNATESKEKKRTFFFHLLFLNAWLYGFASICLFALYNPFISLYFGSQYTFVPIIVVAIVLNFLSDGLSQTVTVYKDACGLFWKGKIRPIISAILNLVISIILVRPLGILGVILGTILSRYLVTWWFDGMLVCRNVFEESPARYYFVYLKYLITIIINGIITYFVVDFVRIPSIFGLVVKVMICLILPNLLFLICFYKTPSFYYYKTVAKDLLTKKSH